LTYAEQRALEIGVTIAGGAEVILLDEPTAGMSRAEARHAVQTDPRGDEGKTLLMVEHDMSVVFELADRISVVVYGQVIASGTPDGRSAPTAAVRRRISGTGLLMSALDCCRRTCRRTTARVTCCTAST
jgi:branched-chain amino acid transport system ATP-binding protein